MSLAQRVSLALGLVAALTSPALASPPSPVNSTVPPCLVTSPDGTYPFTVVVRDFFNNLRPRITVVLDFSGCPGAVFCPTPCTSCAVDAAARTVGLVTDSNGTASFDLRMGGTGAAGTVLVSGSGVLLATRALASLDQDGDLMVTAADVALVNAKLGSSDPTADFDCSGAVDAADLAILQSHLGATCTGVTPARPRSWGTVKIRYR